MELFDVYPRYDVEPVKGQGCFVWDRSGQKYLDLYCGHAVISIGHSHPHYVERITKQVQALGFYSNSVKNAVQESLAAKLGELSGYEDYTLFLCNSGAEANENALKLASFQTGRDRVISFQKGFHGRTSLALEATDDCKNLAPINKTGKVTKLPFNHVEGLSEHLDDSVAAVIVEGIQGIAGIYESDVKFLKAVESECKKHGILLILDEIQAGYGRSGKFFAHEYAGIEPDMITTGKGMGNGFPLAGVLISPDIKSWSGMTGTTFGGNHMACAAGLAVLEVLESEELIKNAEVMGKHLISELAHIPQIKEVRGKGLMIGIELEEEVKAIRSKLLFDHQIFTGSAMNPKTLRILPPLCIQEAELDHFLHSFKQVLV